MLSSVDVGVPCGGMPIGSGADCGFGSRRAREGALILENRVYSFSVCRCPPSVVPLITPSLI